MVRTIFLAIAMSVLSVSCASGPCRELRQPELAAQQDRKSEVNKETALAGAPTTVTVAPPKPPVTTQPGAAAAKPSANKDSTVLIYKADGSLQCGTARGVSVDEMEKQLAGIKIYSREKRPDGLMHIQVCGSPTGMINVYEIELGELLKAEKLGFKRFESR